MSPEKAIDQLFDLYAVDIYRFALHSIGNQADAKDIVQEVFLKAYVAWRKFRGDANPKTWLFQIARNHIRDLFRKRRIENHYLKDYRPILDDEPAPIETIIEMRKAILNLKLEYRQVVALRFIEDLSVKDTAAILGWSEQKVRTTQYRALQQLRNRLNGANAHQNDSVTKGR